MLHEILWQQNVRLAEACLHHPFVRGLADGTVEVWSLPYDRRSAAEVAAFVGRRVPIRLVDGLPHPVLPGP